MTVSTMNLLMCMIEKCANVALSCNQASLNEDIEGSDDESGDSENDFNYEDIGNVDEEIDQPLSPNNVNDFDGALSDE
jgi:hypothetical protein